MDLVTAVAIHRKLFEEAVHPNVTSGREGATFIGMAIALELVRLHPEKADRLREVLTVMRDEVLGNDKLWTDVVDAMAPILSTEAPSNG